MLCWSPRPALTLAECECCVMLPVEPLGDRRSTRWLPFWPQPQPKVPNLTLGNCSRSFWPQKAIKSGSQVREMRSHLNADSPTFALELGAKKRRKLPRSIFFFQWQPVLEYLDSGVLFISPDKRPPPQLTVELLYLYLSQKLASRPTDRPTRSSRVWVQCAAPQSDRRAISGSDWRQWPNWGDRDGERSGR